MAKLCGVATPPAGTSHEVAAVVPVLEIASRGDQRPFCFEVIAKQPVRLRRLPVPALVGVGRLRAPTVSMPWLGVEQEAQAVERRRSDKQRCNIESVVKSSFPQALL